jgi:hypothetical protein
MTMKYTAPPGMLPSPSEAAAGDGGDGAGNNAFFAMPVLHQK